MLCQSRTDYEKHLFLLGIFNHCLYLQGDICVQLHGTDWGRMAEWILHQTQSTVKGLWGLISATGHEFKGLGELLIHATFIHPAAVGTW